MRGLSAAWLLAAVVSSASTPLGVSEAARGGVWRAALDRWTEVARAERKKGDKGRYIVAFADDYGLGNRVNVVVSSLALAMASGRALAVVWPKADCRHSRRENCDPTSIDDLFVGNANVSWGLNRYVAPSVVKCRDERDRRRKSADHWAMADPNDRKTADHYRKLDFDSEAGGFRSDRSILCTYGYFFWGWCVTCNSHVRAKWGLHPSDGGSPWKDFGALQDWLLEPSHPVLKRYGAILGKGGTCQLGVHLRRADERDRGRDVFNPKWVRVLEDALRPGAAVFIAADPESSRTKLKLVDVIRDAGATLLGADRATATRDSESGIYDALAENYVLSSCDDLLPRGTGASTFHDLAVGRAAFEQDWNDTRAAKFAERTKDKPARPLIAPALCADLRAPPASPANATAPDAEDEEDGGGRLRGARRK